MQLPAPVFGPAEGAHQLILACGMLCDNDPWPVYTELPGAVPAFEPVGRDLSCDKDDRRGRGRKN